MQVKSCDNVKRNKTLSQLSLPETQKQLFNTTCELALYLRHGIMKVFMFLIKMLISISL